MESKVVEFNGETYIRNPKSRYYFKRTTRNAERRGATQLHRAVWEYYHGEIPEGYHIHHGDGNIDNNDISNLECIQAHKHLSIHAQENKKNPVYVARQAENIKKAGQAAKQWHKSDAGREWHKQHVAESIGKVWNNRQDKQCEFCGNTFKGLPWSKYCCTSCMGKASWQRRKQRASLQSDG